MVAVASSVSSVRHSSFCFFPVSHPVLYSLKLTLFLTHVGCLTALRSEGVRVTGVVFPFSFLLVTTISQRQELIRFLGMSRLRAKGEVV